MFSNVTPTRGRLVKGNADFAAFRGWSGLQNDARPHNRCSLSQRLARWKMLRLGRTGWGCLCRKSVKSATAFAQCGQASTCSPQVRVNSAKCSMVFEWKPPTVSNSRMSLSISRCSEGRTSHGGTFGAGMGLFAFMRVTVILKNVCTSGGWRRGMGN